MNKITLAPNIIDENDINSLTEWLKGNPKLTKGNLTKEFEKKFAEWLGVRYAVFVNSGSSANLLMIDAVRHRNRQYKNQIKKVVVPALSWATDLAPVMQLGLEPILCDCNMDDLSLDLEHLKRICREQNPDAILLVHVLGIIPQITDIIQIANQYNIWLLEDTCEAMGSESGGYKLGSFGDISTFSFYWGHHISTIEGGMVCTDSAEFYNILKSLRSHGWVRDLEEPYQEFLISEEESLGLTIDDFDRQFTFHFPGYNVRSTDLQAFLGIRQLDKIEKITKRRKEIFELFRRNLFNLYVTPNSDENSTTSIFAWPVICKSKSHKAYLAHELTLNGIECRPLICGSMGRQPFYVKEYGQKSLPNADKISERGLYVPAHQDVSDEDVLRICSIIRNSFNA